MTPKILLTPGPANTTLSVKLAMLRDLGSREPEFLRIVEQVRTQLLDVADFAKSATFESILLQGSGSFAIESVLSSVIPDKGKLLVLSAGAYGDRIAEIASRLGVVVEVLKHPAHECPPCRELRKALRKDNFTHVAMVHCETSTGAIYPLGDVGAIVRQEDKLFIVDAMSTFGAVPIDVEESSIDFLVSSANKCLQGVPGISFVLARRAALQRYARAPRTLVLDLHAQLKQLRATSEFRFTPPTHVILALAEALRELEAEGGVRARAKRYAKNKRQLIVGMRALGFREYLPIRRQSYVIIAFHQPQNRRFTYEMFYSSLIALGFVIYPASIQGTKCFRVGVIGNLYPEAIGRFLKSVQSTLNRMDVVLRPSIARKL